MAPCANGPVQLLLVTVLPSRRSGVRVWVRGVDYSYCSYFLRKIAKVVSTFIESSSQSIIARLQGAARKAFAARALWLFSG